MSSDESLTSNFNETNTCISFTGTLSCIIDDLIS